MISDEDRAAITWTTPVDADDTDTYAAVERIVARHVAAALEPVEALAAEWERGLFVWSDPYAAAPAELRAALAEARRAGGGA